jgi:hypothetical protein
MGTMKKIASLMVIVALLIFLSSCIEYEPIEETIDNDPTVVPTDPIDPTVILPIIYDFSLRSGSDTVEINTLWTDAQAYLSIEMEEIEVIGTHQIDTSVIGTYLVNYSIVHEEITYTLTRMVIVVDQTPPRLTLNPGIDTIKLGETWIDGHVTATDNSLGEISIVVVSNVNTNQVGQYQVVYTATDLSGNTSHIVRIVTVYQ